MWKRIAAAADQGQRDAAVREAAVLLRLARMLNLVARLLLAWRWRWAAWGLFHAAEALARQAQRLCGIQVRRRG